MIAFAQKTLTFTKFYFHWRYYSGSYVENMCIHDCDKTFENDELAREVDCSLEDNIKMDHK
jgi:hypothetical protein